MALNDDIWIDKQNLIGFADANWAESRIDRKSTSGYLFQFNGGSITQRSNKQDSVAVSTTEAELYSLSESVKEAKWVRDLLLEINLLPEEKIIFYEDNSSTKKIAESGQQSDRTKHIVVRYFILDSIKRGIISWCECSSENQVADINKTDILTFFYKSIQSYHRYNTINYLTLNNFIE